MRSFLLCVLGVCLLCGCGQKGPLTLPDAKKHKVPAATTHPEPAPAPPAGAAAPDGSR